MESEPAVPGGKQRCKINVRVKPLGIGNSDIQDVIPDDKAASKRFKSAENNEIVIGDIDPKKKVSVYKCNHVAKDDIS